MRFLWSYGVSIKTTFQCAPSLSLMGVGKPYIAAECSISDSVGCMCTMSASDSTLPP